MDKHKLTFTQVVEGYILAQEARQLSVHTLDDYKNTFNKILKFWEFDPVFNEIAAEDIEQFLATIGSTPQEVGGVAPRYIEKLSEKTLLNYHTGLSALWTWAVGNALAERHVLEKIKPPKPKKSEIVPLSKDDIEAMLAVVDRSQPYKRPGKRECSHKLPTATRNRTIILLLLDTGIRVSELCDLRIRDVDQRNRRVKVLGKGNKERSLPYCPATGQAIWRYLSSRPDSSVDDFLFVTENGQRLDRRYVRTTLKRIGDRANVRGVHPHRFRHTFAVNYLRNGGNAYGLQSSLGHESLEMVKKYLQIVQADLDNAHRQASPVANWQLR